jgi:hypothetical protein
MILFMGLERYLKEAKTRKPEFQSSRLQIKGRQGDTL